MATDVPSRSANPGATLSEELALITSLVGLMKQEQQLLVSADTEGLSALTPQKDQQIAQLAALSKQRHQSLDVAGFPARDAGMETWLDSARDAAATSAWQALLDATREAKELNRVNGMLITKQLTHNQNLINAMRTPSGGSESGVYGPKGQTTPMGPSRRFVIG